MWQSQIYTTVLSRYVSLWNVRGFLIGPWAVKTGFETLHWYEQTRSDVKYVNLLQFDITILG